MAGSRDFDDRPTPEQVGAHMYASDHASQALGMKIVALGAGTATLEMAVRDDMLNGHAICHGGFITTLADSAFAFACNSRNQLTVAAGLTIDFLQQVERGDVLTAVAVEVSRSGRTGVYDMVVTNRAGERVALVRGRSATLTGRTVIPVALNEEAP
ncbi:MAG TPA: hydroxyphenylacetyl-CoA thioesterase PaaI [Caldimonas sp.]|nr:hydroxyphenylacetyl-CoA thioesterase PaaI [Caldimonas sp.]